MLQDILNKILLTLFIMSILNVVRHSYYFIQIWVKSNEANPQRYVISDKSLWVLSMSIAYIIGSIIDGIKI